MGLSRLPRCPEMGPPDGLANRDQVWFSRSMSACSLFFLDLLHIDLKTAFLQGELYDLELYDLERRVIHVQLPTDIGLPPYLVGLCTRSVYGLSDAPRRWWNRLDKFLHSLGLVPTRADRCTYVCYSGCLRVPKAVNYSSEEMPAEPEPVSFYVAGAPPNEFHDTAEEVRRFFSVKNVCFRCVTEIGRRRR